MAILLWLLPAVVATALAMCWVAFVGRERTALSDRSEAAQRQAQQRFAEAILRPMPDSAVRRTPPRERSTGVAIRRDRSSA